MSRDDSNTLYKIKATYRRSLLWSTLCTIALFGIADANAPLAIFATLGVTLAWTISVKNDQPISRFMINVALVLVISLAALVTLRSGVGVSAFAIFAAMLMVVKLFDLRTARDDGQVLVLLVVLVVAAVLTSNSMLTGLMLVITGVLLLRTIARFHIYLAASQVNQESLAIVITPRSRIDFRSFQIATLFLSALIGTLVFLVLPRNIGTSAFGDWGTASTGAITSSGFADQVQLGRPGLISQSSTPVLDLQVFDRNEQNIGSLESPAIYLRGAVLTKYNNGRWVRDTTTPGSMLGIHRVPPNTTVHPAVNPTRQSWDREYKISLRGASLRGSAIFLPWMPTEFRSPNAIRIGIDSKGTGQMIHSGTGSSVNYRVRTINTELLEVPFPESYQRSRNNALLGGVTPQITQLAAQIIENAGVDPNPETRPFTDDTAVLRVLENYLQTKYTYTLQSEPVPPDQDATEWFLFDRQEGHCEYYASALALMARSAGIEARVVTGYVASDFNDVTGQYIVRESNAHAWVEAKVAPLKWIIFDGTPRADFQQIHEPKPSAFRWITRWYETIEYAWVKGVVGYDSQSRREIFGDIAPDLGLMKFGYKIRNRLQHARADLIKKAALVAIMVFGITFTLGLILIRFRTLWAAIINPIAAFFQRLAARFTGRSLSPQEYQASRLEHAIARTLDLAQITRQHWIPLQTTLSSMPLNLHHESVYQSLDHASKTLYRLRFGPPASPPETGEIARVIEQLRASEKQLIRKK